jgi:hypothetical protein
MLTLILKRGVEAIQLAALKAAERSDGASVWSAGRTHNPNHSP